MTLFINPLHTSLLFIYVGELLTDKHVKFSKVSGQQIQEHLWPAINTDLTQNNQGSG